MGERALFYRDDVPYPGLVKPYLKDNDSIDQSVIDSSSRTSSEAGLSNRYSRMNELNMNQKQNSDPFSRYDDDMGEEHYFLVPKIQGNSLQFCEWRRTVKSSRSLKNIAKLASDVKQIDPPVGKNRTQTYPPYYRTPPQTPSIVDNQKFAGEYCCISTEEKLSKSSSKQPVTGSNLRTSFYHSRDGECLRDFASKFATDQDERPKPQNHSHSFEGKRQDTWVELDGLNDSKSKRKIARTQPENIVDYCTCMVCVKGLFYHIGDDEDSADNPCSCVGSKGSVLKRWTCLSILACLMPCLFCYLPAKGCLNLCRTCRNNNDQRTPDSELRATYKKSDKRKAKETTTLL